MTLESKARRVPKESKVLKAIQGTQDLRVPRVIPGTPAPRARKGLKVQRVRRESLALRAIRVTPVPRGSKATKENPEPHILRV